MHPLNHAIDTTLSGRPLLVTLSALEASDFLDVDLRELLSHMDDGRAMVALNTEWLKGYFWEAGAPKEDDTMLVAPTPVSSDIYFGPSNFAAWVDQGPANSDKIRFVCALFEAAEENSIG